MPSSSNLGLELFVPGANIAEWSEIISTNFSQVDSSFSEIINARGSFLSLEERIDYLEAGVTTGTFTPAVLSINGMTGSVVLQKADIGLDQVDNTADTDKPISSSVQFALDQKSDKAHSHSVANITGLTGALAQKSPVGHTHNPSEVGLGFVKNIRPEDMPISSAVASALDQKADSNQHWPIDNITGLRTVLDSIGAPSRYEAIMSGMIYSIPSSVHNISKVSSVTILNPYGKSVSVVFNIDSSENVVIEAGLPLDDYKVILLGI